MDIEKWQAGLPHPPPHLGVKLTHVERDRLLAELTAWPEIRTRRSLTPRHGLDRRTRVAAPGTADTGDGYAAAV